MAETMTGTSTVVGYFSTRSKAENAIDALADAGFTSDQIGVAARGSDGRSGGQMGDNALATDEDYTGTGRGVGGGLDTDRMSTNRGGYDRTGEDLGDRTRDKAHEAGEHVESAWDKVKSFFGGGEPVEPYADERTDGAFASREITADDNGYDHEHLHGSLENITGSGEHAQYFGGRMQQGGDGVLVTVRTNSVPQQQTAERILEENGADLGRDRQSFAGTGTGAAATADGQQNIQLFGEVLRVHKDRVSRGEVRLRKEIHTETQTIQVPVSREELVIERVPVSGERATLGATGDAFSEREIRVPLSEERASIEKQAVLREEVRVGKREVTDTKSFDESVRNEDLAVDDATGGRKQ